MFTPFALELYRRHVAGETAEKLSRELGIPVERIEQRLQAAASYVARQGKRGNSISPLEAYPDRAA